MYAPTGRGEKWVMNSEGIVLEYSSEPFKKSDEIIAGINAHYGTSFYQEDDIDKDFTIGDTVPNWNAYEKITIQGYFAVSFGYRIFGYLKDGIYEMARYSNGKGYTATESGVILQQTVPAPGESGYDDFETAVKQKFLQNNIILNDIVGKIETYAVGDTVTNWNEYTLLE